MSKPRQVRGLWKVELHDQGPFTKEPRLKGKAAEGIRYQRKIHRLMEPLESFGPLLEEPWFRYADTYGVHWCRPDSVLELHDRVLVVEAKLSLRRYEDAMTQLNKLYRPVVGEFFSKPVAMVMAFKHWIPGVWTFPLVQSPEETFTFPIGKLKEPVGWHVM